MAGHLLHAPEVELVEAGETNESCVCLGSLGGVLAPGLGFFAPAPALGRGSGSVLASSLLRSGSGTDTGTDTGAGTGTGTSRGVCFGFVFALSGGERFKADCACGNVGVGVGVRVSRSGRRIGHEAVCEEECLSTVCISASTLPSYAVFRKEAVSPLPKERRGHVHRESMRDRALAKREG